MDLKQKNYVFAASVAIVDEEKAESIFLKINDKLTTIKLLDLFVGKIKTNFSEDNDAKFTFEIKGWSIIQMLKVANEENYNSLSIQDEEKIEKVKIDFCFKEEENCIELNLINIETPLIQFNDKEIEEVELDKIFKKILELSNPKKEGKDKGAGVGSPHSEPALIKNTNYENFSKRFLAKGFSVINGKDNEKNFHFFISPNKEKLSGKTFLVEVVSETEAIQYDELTENPDFFQFVDNDKNRFINVYLEDNNSINIEFEPVTKETV